MTLGIIQESSQISETPEISDRQIAKSLGVSPTTVGTTRKSMGEHVSNLDTSIGADGKLYPRKRSTVFAKDSIEADRAFAAIAKAADKLPSEILDVSRVERIAKKQQLAPEPDPIAIPASDGQIDIRCGDFTSVLADIEPESVALILTAPTDACDLHQLEELSSFGGEKLKPGGLLLACIGQSDLPDVMVALSKHLEYVWMISVVERGPKTQVEARKVSSKWKPVLVYCKPPLQQREWTDDVFQGNGAEALHFVEAFSSPGDIVVDPFVGSGTNAVACLRLGRSFVGCDIDPTSAQNVVQRIQKGLTPTKENPEIIDSFRRPYSFLSNMSKAEISLDGRTYLSVEHAYQAAKTHDVNFKNKIVAIRRADYAKHAGERVKLREDWNEVRLGIMRELLNLKFQDERKVAKLIATGDAVLVEGNHWHDNFWGNCTCGRKKCAGEGQNHLGKLLMELRKQLKYGSEATNEKKKHYRAPYFYLSNFSKSPLMVDGILYPTVEHAYQAAKTNDVAEKVRIASTANPVVAKRLGGKVQMREDWDAAKRGVMRELLTLKFQDPSLAEKLLSTPDGVLVEGSLLMEIREQLKASR